MSLHPHTQGLIAERVRQGIERYSRTGRVDRYAKDASGHEHKGKGPGGGQFTSGGGGGASGADAKGPSQPTAKPDATKPAASAAVNQPKTAPPPGGYSPDPAKGEAARVGVPGHAVPPPPTMQDLQLPNLTPEEREIEQQFASMFEADPDGLAAKVIARMQIPKGEPGYMGGDGPSVFGTDDVKMMFPQWEGTTVTGPDGKPVLSDETKEFRSRYNTALHQTANALAKRAFLQYLDTVVAKLPPEKRQVLVTAGGVAAGKGFAIKNVPQVAERKDRSAATWDTAGEQNSTELPWVAEECKKRGIAITAVFVHADPKNRWENPGAGVIERAGRVGRMVDARPFAESYTYGARNFHEFHQKYANDPWVHIAIIDNNRGLTPVDVPEVPAEMRTMDPEKLYAECLAALEKTNASDAVKAGGAAGARIWGPPAQKSAENEPRPAD